MVTEVRPVGYGAIPQPSLGLFWTGRQVVEREDGPEAFVLKYGVADEEKVQTRAAVDFGQCKGGTAAHEGPFQTDSCASGALDVQVKKVFLALLGSAHGETREAEHDVVMRRDVHHDLAVHFAGVVHQPVPARCLNKTCPHRRSD